MREVNARRAAVRSIAWLGALRETWNKSTQIQDGADNDSSKERLKARSGNLNVESASAHDGSQRKEKNDCHEREPQQTECESQSDQCERDHDGAMMAAVIGEDEHIEPLQSEQRKTGRSNVNERALKHVPRNCDWRKYPHAPNENKISDGWRDGAWLRFEGGISWEVRSQSCQPFAASFG
ncbi:MAG TPA: hypothetical protein VE031_13520 [Chthoniobacterales bacterium]|nr:hypothetical protein [Chthoniobacterales bacterium]